MFFNVFFFILDDHSKNFSFLYKGGNWYVSPAYDLTYSYGMGDEHATTINGEGRNPAEKDILSVAKIISLDQRKTEKIIDETKTAINKANLSMYWR
jgi:serine/threonine-protein kinase HipA